MAHRTSDEWYRIANEDDVPSPALLVYPDRIAENLDRMIAAAGGARRLRPHVKTHKMPDVIRMEIDRGIGKFKVATIAEAEMTAAAGGGDVLLAYPVVGPAARRLAALAAAHPATTFRAITDSAEGIDALSAAAVAAGVVLDVLLDLDVGLGRTGIRPGPEAAALYRRIAAAPGLTAGGLHAYDGHLRDTDHARLVAAAEAAFAPVWAFRAGVEAEGLAVPRTVVSGTPTFAILAARDDVEVGAGTTVLWDAGQAEISPDLDFLAAAVLLARVVSKPGVGRLCLDLGHKAVASEMVHPRLKLLGLTATAFPIHSEEHLVVETPQADDLAVGDVVYAVPRHVCPTVALHDEAVVVRDGRAVDRWPVPARRRRISV
jgi:D-serine deaminase-like pyridoxal phosphate-dependent protein